MFSETRVTLPKTSHLAIRVDGKNFTSLTKPMRKESPFNETFNSRMLASARHLLTMVDGAVLTYVGSDEVSIILPALEGTSERWFGGRLDKMTSISGSLASAAFNSGYGDLAIFDARIIDLGPEAENVQAYLEDRRASIVKNSISMLASFHFSHRELKSVSTRDRVTMLRERGVEWEAVSDHNRFGTVFHKTRRSQTFSTKVRGMETEVTAMRTFVEDFSPLQRTDFGRALGKDSTTETRGNF